MRDVWPGLTRFYGLGYEELGRMPGNVRLAYVERMPRLQAEEQLLGIEVSSYPHTSDDGRAETNSRLDDMRAGRDPGAADAEDVAVGDVRTPAAAGIPVEFVGEHSPESETDPWDGDI